MRTNSVEALREHGIQPSAQRVAVADYVLHTDEHLQRYVEVFETFARDVTSAA